MSLTRVDGARGALYLSRDSQLKRRSERASAVAALHSLRKLSTHEGLNDADL